VSSNVSWKAQLDNICVKNLDEPEPEQPCDFSDNFEGITVSGGSNGANIFTRSGTEVGTTLRGGTGANPTTVSSTGTLAWDASGGGLRASWYFPSIPSPIGFKDELVVEFDFYSETYTSGTNGEGTTGEGQIWFFSKDNSDITATGTPPLNNLNNQPLFMMAVFQGQTKLGVALPTGVDRYSPNLSNGVTIHYKGNNESVGAYQFTDNSQKTLFDVSDVYGV
jgi:hypothetical protein